MALPETLSFSIQQGAPAELHLRLKSEELEGNPAINLTGYGANWEIWTPSGAQNTQRSPLTGLIALMGRSGAD